MASDSHSINLTLDRLISVSCKIFNGAHNLQSSITSVQYVEEVERFLLTFDDKCLKYCCSPNISSLKSRKECSRRLIVLSSLSEVFKQASQTCQQFDPVLKVVTSTTLQEKKRPQNCEAFDTDNDTEGEDLLSNESAQGRSERRQHEEAIAWYKDVATLLLEKDLIKKLMSNCVFTVFLAKKVILECVKYNVSKICIILECVESLLAQDSHENLKVFDLLVEFMSKENKRNNATIIERTYTWFISLYERKFPSSLKQLIQENILQRNEWTTLMSFLSFTKKMIKYGNIQGKTIQPCLLHETLDAFMNFLSYNFSSEECCLQIVLLKIIKIFNMALNLDFILKKDVTTGVLEVAMQILKGFPSYFSRLSTNYFSISKLFWGKEHSHVTSTCIGREESPHQVSCSMTRSFLVVCFKSCLLSSYSESIDAAGIKGLTYQIFDSFQMWFLQKYKDANNSGWLPVLLGEDDDQWITVLLCLLLIHTHLNEKEKKRVSTLQVFHQNPNPEYRDETSGQRTFNIFHDQLCPHRLFVQFINFIAFDHLVLADLLMSPETYFLAYFTKYITLLNKDWEVVYKNYTDFTTMFIDHNTTNASFLDSNKSNANSVSANSTHSDENNSLIIRHSSIINPLSSFSPSQTYLTAPNTFQKVNESVEIEPCNKKMKSTRAVETDQNVVRASLKSNLEKQSRLCSLVSYSDSEDSDCSNVDIDNNDSNKASGSSEIPSFYHSRFSPCSSMTQDDERNISDEKKIISPAFNSSDTKLYPDNQKALSDERILSDSITDDEDKDSNDSESDEDHCDVSSNTLERFMTMLIRLHFHLDHLNDQYLIPYNASLLLKLLKACTDKYDSHESKE